MYDAGLIYGGPLAHAYARIKDLTREVEGASETLGPKQAQLLNEKIELIHRCLANAEEDMVGYGGTRVHRILLEANRMIDIIERAIQQLAS